MRKLVYLDIAQLAEHSAYIRTVVGSNPAVQTNAELLKALCVEQWRYGCPHAIMFKRQAYKPSKQAKAVSLAECAVMANCSNTQGMCVFVTADSIAA